MYEDSFDVETKPVVLQIKWQQSVDGSYVHCVWMQFYVVIALVSNKRATISQL